MINIKTLNKKAFTLIEILATVTILGVLSVVAMVSVNKIIQNAKEKHYTNAEDQLELAGQSYVQQYRSALPKAIGQKVKIPMEKLVQTNYIEQIKDYSDNGCDMKKSYVQVFKYSQNDYSYVAYLECPVYKSTENLKEAAPNIVLTAKGSSMGATADEKQTLTIKINPDDDEENTLEKPAKLISYSYIIYKYDKEVKNSGSISLPNYDTRLNKTIDLTPYTPGKLKIVVTATNIYGLTTTKTITTDYKDIKVPECIINTEDLPSNPKEWGRDPVKITVGCTDENGSGCTREEYTKTFKTTATTGFITIEDLAGNKKKCEVSVNIDLTPPTVPTVTIYKWQDNSTQPTSQSGLEQYTNNTWVNKNLYSVASNSTDANVGFKHYQYVITGKEGAETNIVSTTRNITAEGTTTIKYRACDLLDNCSEYSTVKTIKLDKTAPTIPTLQLVKWSDNSTEPTSVGSLAAYASGTWTNKNIFTVANSPEEGDDTSKIKEYQYTTTGATTNNTNKVSTSRNIKAEGDSTIKYRTCDNAGNCSVYSTTYTIRLDKTKPVIAFTTGDGPYQNNSGITVSSSCTDERSGVASQTGSSTTGSPNCGNITHYCTDNAGNQSSTSKNFNVKYYSANSACGVKEYNTCEAEGCGVNEYNTCTANVCGAKTCATAACGSYESTCSDTCSEGGQTASSCGAKGGSFSQASGTTVTGIGTCTYPCSKPCTKYYTCQHYDCGLNECTHPLCGVKSYNSCADEACGVKSYNSCWHC